MHSGFIDNNHTVVLILVYKSSKLITIEAFNYTTIQLSNYFNKIIMSKKIQNNYTRRDFVKLSTTVLVGSLAGFSGLSYGNTLDEYEQTVSVWDVPGGDFLVSKDYEVVLRRLSKTWKPFTHYTTGRMVDKVIDYDKEAKYIKLGFPNIHSSEANPPEKSKDTFANSWTAFDFSDGPVEVEVKILRPFNGLTLPLKSCAVFPSTLGIDCQIKGDNVISFTIEKPAMMAIVPNHLQALEKLKNINPKQVFEGYRNPLFIFSRTPESNVPSKKEEGTLIVKPGAIYGVEDFNKAKTIYFEAGIHDYSKYNPNDPLHYIELKGGQTVYLEGGAFLYAIVKSKEGNNCKTWPWVKGRGVVSGDKHLWVGDPEINKMIIKVNLEGIVATDPHTHFGGGGITKGVALVGAWHGNTDGINGRRGEKTEGWHIENCFCMAHDTNMGIGEYTRVKNHTIWQMNNAEPLWIRTSQGCVMDGFNVIAYNRFNPRGEVFNYINPGGTQNVATIRNVTIDAPFIPRIMSITTKLDTDEIIFKDVLFENVTVNTPYIRDKSQIGCNIEKKTNFGKVVFKNFKINGVQLTDGNFKDYFELLFGVSLGKEIIVI